MDCMQFKFNFRVDFNVEFQYRKRYGLHAIIGVSSIGVSS